MSIACPYCGKTCKHWDLQCHPSCPEFIAVDAKRRARRDAEHAAAQWVACSDHLPPLVGYASDSVLGIDEHGCFRIYWCGTDGAGASLWHPANQHPPTHWRALPPPPETA